MSLFENLSSSEMEAIEELRRRVKDNLNPDMYDDTLLFYRFLKARDFDIDKAESMLRKHMLWRKAYRIDTILDDFKPLPAYLKYLEGTYLGDDKEGCSVRYLPLGNIDVTDVVNCFKFNDYVRSRVWTLEKDLARMKEMNSKTGRNASKIINIINLDKLQFSNVIHQSSASLYSRSIHVFQDHYPERLKLYIVINAPAYYVILYSILKKILAEEVIRKVRIYGKSGWKEELLKVIDADVLPAFLGGNRTDPDGNPMCSTFVEHGGRMSSAYYLSKKDRSFKDKSKVEHTAIPPRRSHEVCVEVTECESYIQWEYEVGSKDIGFGLYYRESEQELKEILPVYRFDTLDGTEKGSYKCQLLGTYIVIFDNSFSRFSSKEVSYCITVVTP